MHYVERIVISARETWIDKTSLSFKLNTKVIDLNFYFNEFLQNIFKDLKPFFNLIFILI